MNSRFIHLLVCPICKGLLFWDSQRGELYWLNAPAKLFILLKAGNRLKRLLIII